MRRLTLAGVLAGWASAALASAATLPPTVQHFADGLTQRCEAAGGKSSIVGKLAQPIDLNQDKLGDWLLDESAVSCANGPPAGKGSKEIMLFAGMKDGDARPVMQQGVYAYRIEGGTIWGALRGAECGPKGVGDVYCDRPIVWNSRSQRAQFGPMDRVRVPSKLTQ